MGAWLWAGVAAVGWGVARCLASLIAALGWLLGRKASFDVAVVGQHSSAGVPFVCVVISIVCGWRGRARDRA